MDAQFIFTLLANVVAGVLLIVLVLLYSESSYDVKMLYTLFASYVYCMLGGFAALFM